MNENKAASLDDLVDVDTITGEQTTALAKHEGKRDLVTVSDVPMYLRDSTYDGLAELVLSDEMIEALQEPVKDEEVEIKPDRFGAVYLSHGGYRKRLNKAFRPGGWGVRQISAWRYDADAKMLTAEFALKARGSDNRTCFVAKAIGGQQYFGGQGNSTMTYDDAAQGAESNAIMRLCKVLGVAIELWDKRTANKFRDQLGVAVWVKKRDGSAEVVWRRWDEPALRGETGIAGDSPNQDKYKRPAGGGGGGTSQSGSGQAQAGAQGANGGGAVVAGQGNASAAGGQQAAASGTGAAQAGQGGWTVPPPEACEWGKGGIITEKQAKRLYAITQGSGISEADVAAHLKTKYGIVSSKQIRMAVYDEICEWVKTGGAA